MSTKMTTQTSVPLLRTEGLSVALKRRANTPLQIVSDVALSVRRGECLALVGESGSGKSITAMAIASLLPDQMTQHGAVTLSGEDISDLTERRRLKVSGSKIGYVFQDAMTALHPLMSIREQMIRPIRLHRKCGRKEAERRAAELLDQVGIPSVQDVLSSYIHQLSGGMRQRVMIAMAISCEPSLLIADEPTTALDAAVQGRILDLLRDLRITNNLAVLLISHDMTVVAKHSTRLAVMYAGQIVETGTTASVLASPRHPYTQALIDASPERNRKAPRLPTIPGQVPTLDNLPPGCRFAPRCKYEIAACAAPQDMQTWEGDRSARCCNPLEMKP